MQVNVINAGNLDSFDYLLFPEQHPNTRAYLYEQFNNISSALSNIGREFIEESKMIYDKINDSNVARVAKAALRTAKNLFHHNAIYHLDTLESIQEAQPMMQRYIMAEPTIRELYHKQLCNGFSDTYVDAYPDMIEENHYDYRQVMSGMVVETIDANNEATWYSRNYYDELVNDDRELNPVEKIDIIKTWDLMKMFIEEGNDPTDLYGGKISI